MTIAVLLTCFNRREKTMNCLASLFTILPTCKVYLVDDGSTDGTSEAVNAQFPNVNLIKGNGDLFWNRGMYVAWQEAAKRDFDFYLWLNDDVVLYDNCFHELIECSSSVQHKAIITGIIESRSKDEVLYGGFHENKERIESNGGLQIVHYLNGNVVLVPKNVYNQLGPLDPVYHHDLGDVDYGLRAKKKGILTYTTKIPIAYGEKNPIRRERLNGATFKKRFNKLYSPLGSNPSTNFYFRKKHKSTLNAIAYYVFQHFINAIPDSLNGYLFGKKYQ